jgi:hypothetical protein
LRRLVEQVSYGHSDGRVQNKAEFVDGAMTRKATFKSLDFPELRSPLPTGTKGSNFAPSATEPASSGQTGKLGFGLALA